MIAKMTKRGLEEIEFYIPVYCAVYIAREKRKERSRQRDKERKNEICVRRKMYSRKQEG